MKKTLFFFLVLFFQLFSLSGQTVRVLSGVDTTDFEAGLALDTWKGYLGSKPELVFDNPFWSAEEKKKYKDVDLLRAAYPPTIYSSGNQFEIVSFKPLGSGVYETKTLIQKSDAKLGTHPLYLITTYVKKEGNDYKLINSLKTRTKTWLRTQSGRITYFTSPLVKFNEEKAEKLNLFINDTLVKIFKVKIMNVEYYIGKDFDEVQAARGFEIYPSMGNKTTVKSQSDPVNKIIYVGGGDENNTFEMFRVYVDPIYPNAHPILLKSLAAVYGNYNNKTWEWHLRNFAAWLKAHPSTDLNNPFKLPYIDAMTDPSIVIGGILIKKALKEGGLEKVNEMMEYGIQDKDFMRITEFMFSIKKVEFGDYFYDEIGRAAASSKIKFP